MEQMQRKAVIIGGLRTPFVKRNGAFKGLSALDLGRFSVAELIQHYDISPNEVDAIIFGQVIPSLAAPNIAREIVLSLGMSAKTDAFTINRACATGYQTVISAVQQIEQGGAECIIAGGADSASDIPLKFSDPLKNLANELKDRSSWSERLQAFKQLELTDLKPELPQLRERSTGLSMGESAEKMAKENHISRQMQDDYAYESHRKAARAWDEGKFADEVMTVFTPPEFDFVRCDKIVRFDSDREAYDKLRPVFDAEHGSITAGNSSPLSDGASAVLLMEEKRAKKLNLPILGYLKSYAFAAVDPYKQLLIGPAYAAPKALAAAKLSWSDLDLIDMHEAFAAQILSVIQDLNAHGNTIDMEKFNVNGGSIALGHPFAATGGRQITQTLNELKRRQQKLALCSACAAGGLSAAVVIEAA